MELLKMDRKKISNINKLYDLLYNLNSYNNLFIDNTFKENIKNQMDFLEEFMLIKGYKMNINNKDKCVFIKIK